MEIKDELVAGLSTARQALLAARDAANEVAMAKLRAELSPAQVTDLDRTGWFNVRDNTSKRKALWRVHGGYLDLLPNMVDFLGNGRTMVSDEQEFTPNPDLALALVYYLADPMWAAFIHSDACFSWTSQPSPASKAVCSIYCDELDKVSLSPWCQSILDLRPPGLLQRMFNMGLHWRRPGD